MKTLRIVAILAMLASLVFACHSSKKTAYNRKDLIKEKEHDSEQVTQNENLFNKLTANLEAARNENVVIERTSESVTITFQPIIAFNSNEDQLTEISKEQLEKTAQILSKYTYTEIFIEGHADSSGNQVLNKKLSIERAKNVALFLKAHEVKTERLAVSGYSATRPLASKPRPKEGEKIGEF